MPLPESLTTSSHRDLDLRLVAGVWPNDLSGDVLFSAPMLSGGVPYGIFDFGAMIRLSLTAGTRGAPSDRFAWRVHRIHTPSERIHAEIPQAFMANSVGYQSPFGPPNAANTAPLPWGSRVFATWDAGRPVELDPVTLDFVAEVGSIASWGPSPLFGDTVLPFLLSSAHPVVDPERNGLWTTKLDPVVGDRFGLAPSLVWWDSQSSEVRQWPLAGIVFEGSTHTVSQTRDWVILCDSGNFKADMGEMMGGERTVTVDSDAAVWLLRKDEVMNTAPGTPVEPKCFRVAPPSGHFYARYDDREGVSVVWEGMDLMDLGLYVRADDRDINGNPVAPSAVGLYNMAMAPETLMEVVFDPESGTVSERGVYRDEGSFNLQLSAMDWSTEGLETPTLHHVNFQGCRPSRVLERAAKLYEGRIKPDQLREETPGYLASFARGSMQITARWDYQNLGDLITSPTFVPRDPGADPTQSSYAGSEPGGHDGYVVQPVLSDDGFRVEVFDAAQVSAGPVATLMGPGRECVPVLLHSAWMPVATGLVDAPRLSFASELTEARLGRLTAEQREVVERVARD